MCMTGIMNALDSCDRNALVFVYTDAPAKDAHLRTQVSALANAKKSKITFLLSNNAVLRSASLSLYSSSDLTVRASDNFEGMYGEIASSSGGDVVKTSNKDIAAVSADLINAHDVSKPFQDLVKASYTTSASSQHFEFLVDPTIDELKVRVTGKVTTMKLVINDPSAPALNITVSADLASLKTWRVYNPPPGVYTLTVTTTSPFSVSIAGSSQLASRVSVATHEAGAHGGMFVIDGEPVAGMEASLLVEEQGAATHR